MSNPVKPGFAVGPEVATSFEGGMPDKLSLRATCEIPAWETELFLGVRVLEVPKEADKPAPAAEEPKDSDKEDEDKEDVGFDEDVIPLAQIAAGAGPHPAGERADAADPALELSPDAPEQELLSHVVSAKRHVHFSEFWATQRDNYDGADFGDPKGDLYEDLKLWDAWLQERYPAYHTGWRSKSAGDGCPLPESSHFKFPRSIGGRVSGRGVELRYLEPTEFPEVVPAGAALWIFSAGRFVHTYEDP